MERLQVLSERKILKLISSLLYSPGIFLETAYFDRESKRSFLFSSPKSILVYNLGKDLNIFFKELDYWLSLGFWVCGYFSYEFGYLFESSLKSLITSKEIKTPLVWLGVFKKPLIIEHKHLKKSKSLFNVNIENSFRLTKPHLNMKISEYKKAIEKIKSYLRRGQTYQVNFTLKYKAKFWGDILKFYLHLRRNQPTPYASFINDGRRYILSFSPELFFRKKEEKILVRPMKGTFRRGRYLEEDEENAQVLRDDLKNRAENLMIVDLLRNDLGKISRPGSVRVKSLFDIEKHLSLFQMTSTIEARLKRKSTPQEIVKALFPSGSVTGAPKIRTMQIIKSLEKEPRDIYTGAIGFISPYNKEACFNVAIRTLIVRENDLEMGLGGGIVYDSKPQKEYQECLLKANFLSKRRITFSLIESILYSQGRFWLLSYHLRRLKDSCQYFDISLDLGYLRKKLLSLSQRLSQKKKYKIRVLVDTQGSFRISCSPLKEVKTEVLVKLSSKKTDPSDIFLYHKTTQRAFYEEERKKALSEGFFEVIFTNKRGELTEGSISNIFVVNKNKIYTPSLSSGLLPGVLREHLLKTKKVQEKVLYLKDIFEAKEVFIGNSLRGLLKAKIILEEN